MIVSDSTRATAAVAQMQSHNAVRMPRRDPGWHCLADRSSCMRNLERIDVDVAAFFANRLGDAQLLRSVWTD